MYNYMYISVCIGFLCMYLMIFSSLINLWYALLASSHLIQCIGMYSNINSSIKLLSANNISDEQVAIVNNLSTLLPVKSGSHDIIGFNFNEVNDLIHHISTM